MDSLFSATDLGITTATEIPGQLTIDDVIAEIEADAIHAADDAHAYGALFGSADYLGADGNLFGVAA